MIQSTPFEVTVTAPNSISIPNAVGDLFYAKGFKRVLVQLQFKNFNTQFHAGLMRSKNGQYTIMFSKNKQEQWGIYTNDYFTLTLVQDQSTYGVEIPEEFTVVIAEDPEVMGLFNKLTKGTQRGVLYHIARFKTQQTRVDKCLLLAQNLKKGVTDRLHLFKK